MRTEAQKQKRKEFDKSRRHPCLDCGTLICERCQRCKSCSLKKAYLDGKMRHKPPVKVCPKCGKFISAKAFSCQKCRGYRLKGEQHPNWKGGRIIKDGYIQIKRPAKRGYIYEHILIWEQAHGKSLPKGWVIHHYNGIKNDNRPSNLFAKSKKQHRLVIPELQKRIQELEAILKNQGQLC